jgi:hypothetical protein
LEELPAFNQTTISTPLESYPVSEPLKDKTNAGISKEDPEENQFIYFFHFYISVAPAFRFCEE